MNIVKRIATIVELKHLELKAENGEGFGYYARTSLYGIPFGIATFIATLDAGVEITNSALAGVIGWLIGWCFLGPFVLTKARDYVFWQHDSWHAEEHFPGITKRIDNLKYRLLH